MAILLTALPSSSTNKYYNLFKTSIGMKAYKSINDENDIRLFRPQLNMKRLSNSMERLCLPGSDFDHEELIDCIAKLVRLGKFVEKFLCLGL